MTDQSKGPATVVLVHGAWGDASGWSGVIRLLQAKGIAVIAVQNPTTTLADDAEATRLILDKVSGPVVLAGHSWGGTVITEAGSHPKVKALVYVAAFAPDVGQSTGDQVAAHPAPPGLGGVSQDAAGRYWMSAESWVANVAQDLPEADARVLAAIQTPLGAATFGDKVTKAAWKEKPNWYILSRNDRAVSVDLQHALAKQLKARTTELEASHMSLISHPQMVAAVIGEALAHVAAHA